LRNETNENIFGDLGKSVKDWNGVPSYRILSFLFKYFPSPDGSGFDYFPRLVREPVLFREQGGIYDVTGKVVLSSTLYDPLGDVTVGEIIRMAYGKWHNTMLPGKVVTKIWNPLRFARHALFKLDFAATLINSYDPEQSARDKDIMKIAKRF
jgi:hypothetical protein